MVTSDRSKCSKVPYRTPVEASFALARIRSKFPTTRGVHFCAKCRAYHLTSAKGVKRLNEGKKF